MVKPANNSSANNSSVTNSGVAKSLLRSDKSRRMLASMNDISISDILVDVSDNASRHIKGSIVLPYTEFDVVPGIPKTPSEIAQVLGNAGISRNDSVVLYGECLPCGGGPSLATYVYWIMKSMGHENVRVLDGNVEDWAAAGRETTNESGIRPERFTCLKSCLTTAPHMVTCRMAMSRSLTRGPYRNMEQATYLDL